MGENTALSGMTAIRDYCRSINLASSEVSIIQFIRDCGFPARKLGGIWESDKVKITEWRRGYVSGEVGYEKEGDKKQEGNATGAKKMKKAAR
jgi:hypothetical protein